MNKPLICWADTETGSECNLKTAGLFAYWEHPSSFIQMFQYAFDDGPAQIWDKYSGEPMPKDLKDAFSNPNCTFYFFNAIFDVTGIKKDLDIDLPPSRYRCLMAKALSHSLPGSLDSWETVMGVSEEAHKIKDGKRLIQLFAVPKKQKDGSFKWATPKTHPEDWAKYVEYGRVDVIGMREAAKKMPTYNYPRQPELDYWMMDQEINKHGMLMDMELVHAAVSDVYAEQIKLAEKTALLTDGIVGSATQRDALLRYINSTYEIDLPNMRKADLNRLLDNTELEADLRELIHVRLSSCTSSTAKYKKLIKAVNADNRLRGTTQYCGAGRTGRSGGKIYNPLNLPRPTLDHTTILSGIDALKSGSADLLYDVMKLSSSAIRYAIIAPKGKKFIIADMKAIEARVTPYIANEESDIQFYRDYDAGLIKYDNYVSAYASAFNISPSQVTKDQRQIGKILVLALGFGGSSGSIVSFANMFKIDISDLASKIRLNSSKETLIEAAKFYEWMTEQDIKAAKEVTIEQNKQFDVQGDIGWEDNFIPRRTFGLEKEVFVSLDSAKRLWRDSHPAIKQCWKDADIAMRSAIAVPKTKFWFGKCYMIRSGNWVRTVLPSGRSICYPGAKVTENNNLVFYGIHPLTKQWGEQFTTGPKLFQNCFSEKTKILTSTGIKYIIDVVQGDKVWDGVNWVITNGVSYQGKREVGLWLGLKVTKDHLIFDGNSWLEIGKIHAAESRSALKWALDSVSSLSYQRAYQNEALLNVSVIAVNRIIYRIVRLDGIKKSVACLVRYLRQPQKEEKVEIYSPLNNIPIGVIDIQECIVGAITKNVLNTLIMAQEALQLRKNGGKIREHFLNILSLWKIGINQIKIWIESIMKKATNLKIFDWWIAKSMDVIRELMCSLPIKKKLCVKRNSWSVFYQIGKAKMHSTIISIMVNHWNGSWRNMMKEENVYDLLNCGPHNRFTVLTDYGPVIVHNCVQALARDFLKYGQKLAWDNGYRSILEIYDELVCEVPDTDDFTLDDLIGYMTTNPPWALDMPLAADGFVDYRYHKSLD